VQVSSGARVYSKRRPNQKMPIESQGRTFVRLENGEQISLTEAEADRLFEELWKLAPKLKGAVTAAAKLKRARLWELFHGEDALTADETAAVREAIRRLEDDR
jgi:hypothetical protein